MKAYYEPQMVFRELIQVELSDFLLEKDAKTAFQGLDLGYHGGKSLFFSMAFKGFTRPTKYVKTRYF